METTIKILTRKVAGTMKMETHGNQIAATISVCARPSACKLARAEIKCVWFSADEWERDMMRLCRMVEGDAIAIESRTIMPGHATMSEAERRVREVLGRILGVSI